MVVAHLKKLLNYTFFPFWITLYTGKKNCTNNAVAWLCVKVALRRSRTENNAPSRPLSSYRRLFPANKEQPPVEGLLISNILIVILKTSRMVWLHICHVFYIVSLQNKWASHSSGDSLLFSYMNCPRRGELCNGNILHLASILYFFGPENKTPRLIVHWGLNCSIIALP